MTLENQLESILKELALSLEDARKCDQGFSGAPGTRLRKASSKAQRALKSLRAHVSKARKGEE